MAARRSKAPSGHPAAAETRTALLTTAAAVFAEAGFRKATIRDICRRAGANVAAVHYHFGDKAGLYTAVLQDCYRAAREEYPVDLGLPPRPSPERRLHAFVRSLLLRIFSSGRGAIHGKLMAREMVDPTPALDALARDEIAPMARILLGIVGDILGPGAPADTLRLSSMSVVSQVLFYHHCRPVISRVFPEVRFTPEKLDQLADHITRFSLSALRHPARDAGSRRQRPRTKASR